MIQEILGLSKVLMVVPSIQEDSKAIDLALEIAGEELYGFPLKRYERNHVPSLLYSNQPWKDPHFKIILNTNLDVVEADKSFYRPYKKDGRLYGRGAYAMKAPAAAMIFAFKTVAEKVNYPLALQIVTDEETGGRDGTKYQIEEGVRGDFILTSALTDFNISNETKGALWLKIISKGTMAHTAKPWEGENALSILIEFLQELKSAFPTPNHNVWESTVTLSNIITKNHTFNNIPEYCEAWIDIRYLPHEDKTILEKINTLLPKTCKVETILNDFPQYTSKQNPYIQNLITSYSKVTGQKPKIIRKCFADEVKHFSQVGNVGVGFSPIGGNIHSNYEWVDIQSLEKYYQILVDFLLSANNL